MAANPASADLEKGHTSHGSTYMTAYVRDITYKVIPFCIVFIVIFSIGAILVSTVAFGRPIPQQGTIAISILLAVLFFLFCIGCIYLYHEKHYPSVTKAPSSSTKGKMGESGKGVSTLTSSNTAKGASSNCAKNQQSHEPDNNGPAELENPEPVPSRFSAANWTLHPAHTAGQQLHRPSGSRVPGRTTETSNMRPAHSHVGHRASLMRVSVHDRVPSEPTIQEIDERKPQPSVEVPPASNPIPRTPREQTSRVLNSPHPSIGGRTSVASSGPGANIRNIPRLPQASVPGTRANPGLVNPQMTTIPTSQPGVHHHPEGVQPNSISGVSGRNLPSLRPAPLNNSYLVRVPENTNGGVFAGGEFDIEYGPSPRMTASEIWAALPEGQISYSRRKPKDECISPDRRSISPLSGPTRGRRPPEEREVPIYLSQWLPPKVASNVQRTPTFSGFGVLPTTALNSKDSGYSEGILEPQEKSSMTSSPVSPLSPSPPHKQRTTNPHETNGWGYKNPPSGTGNKAMENPEFTNGHLAQKKGNNATQPSTGNPVPRPPPKTKNNNPNKGTAGAPPPTKASQRPNPAHLEAEAGLLLPPRYQPRRKGSTKQKRNPAVPMQDAVFVGWKWQQPPPEQKPKPWRQVATTTSSSSSPAAARGRAPPDIPARSSSWGWRRGSGSTTGRGSGLSTPTK
ncbi:hypothetical protein F4779DRAFT_623882 [Xylariaceae sp. FL0662B]|nr:hypothetical protein F4779DRAFT_623882 [Xylariaceae sp. FL0662B]